MDVEELLNKMEGLRNDIPDFLRNDYDKLIRDLRQIYEASIKYIAPSWPVADAHRLFRSEGLRNDIPDFLRNDYDKLIRDLRQIYEASIKYIAPSWPVADAHRHLQTHSTNLDTLHGQLNKSLPGFKQLYQGQGSDAYHATAGMALQDLGMLRDHASFATQQHQTIANNLDDGLIQRGLLAFFVLDAFISLTAFVGSGGSTAPVTIPAMVISV